ncbi:hypothetical protein MMC20_001732 [Loxospora ochrophaea]|nr:hypothetical protein [Loxospora ochrophaea]
MSLIYPNYKSPYQDESPDFSTLALQSPDFQKHLKSNGQLDFSDPAAVKQLTKSLLKADFGIEIDLPDDRLCPPVPNRLNYILWIQALLDTTSGRLTEQADISQDVIGLDIGTGASCIYPLLGCQQRPNWKFIATDIDEKNMHYARQNILSNDLQSRIRPLPTTPSDPLIPLDALNLSHITFTISNPPFYASTASLLASSASKSRPPHSTCTGSETEMVTPGGEVAFVSRMIDESAELRERVQWYSSMLGKRDSVAAVISTLKNKGAENWAVKEFVQGGGKTRRWGVAWSWGDMRPAMIQQGQDVARPPLPSTLPRHILPFPSTHSIHVPHSSSQSLLSHLSSLLHPLDLQWRYQPPSLQGLVVARQNVWSRSARRRRRKKPHSHSHSQADSSSSSSSSSGNDIPALACMIQLSPSKPNEEEEGSEVAIRWMRGRDSVLFESFCGMVRRGLMSQQQQQQQQAGSDG